MCVFLIEYFQPQPICNIESIGRVVVTREDDITHTVNVYIQPDRFVSFSMEDRDGNEFALVLAGYYRLLTGIHFYAITFHLFSPKEKTNLSNFISFKIFPFETNSNKKIIEKELLLEKEPEEEIEEIAPQFLSQHSVLPATWSYLPNAQGRAHSMVYLNPPPYHSVTNLMVDQSQCDRNMNTTLSNNNNKHHKIPNCVDEFGFDIHSVMTMEILEGTKGKPINGLVETRNEEVLRRVAEMQKMVESSENYLNEQGELIHEIDMRSNTRLPWKDTSLDLDSDCDSMSSSKQSSNEDAPAPGVLKHSDSLILLAESINLDLNGITKGLNLIGLEKHTDGKNPIEGTPKSQRKAQGLSQLLSDLHSISNDLSQSESDSESVCTPNSSPIHRTQSERNRHKAFRSSFGLHSPDSSTIGIDSKDTNLREYLKQLKEASSKDSADIDLAAKKLSELYGFEISDDTFIDSDPDVIDLTAIPPPQTPDELDSLSVLDAAPSGFDDSIKTTQQDGDLEKFLARVIVAPPTQKITPAKELTPEEIMSYIIPPPPGLSDDEASKNKSSIKADEEECLYMNSIKSNIPTQKNDKKVIEYATVDRKGPFSCCSKAKKEEIKNNDQNQEKLQSKDSSPGRPLELPPRQCEHKQKPVPPVRPPKSTELQAKLSSPARTANIAPSTFRLNGGGNGIYYDTIPNRFIPKNDNLASLPPRKPNVPPVPLKPIFRNPIPLPKMIGTENRLASIGSPRLIRNPNMYNEIEKNFTNGVSNLPVIPIPAQRSMNGHYRSNSDCAKDFSKVRAKENTPALSILCSPQMSRKLITDPMKSPPINMNGSPQFETRNGHVINVQSLMIKTEVAMAGLLVKLDQIAAQCSAAQAAGGGVDINETKFQSARDELTERAQTLVTSSKALVASMSESVPILLPENLSACLTALRRITELAQDMAKHTSSPLQTRNIVLKIHDVASGFRELSGVQTGPLGAGALALQAECLTNVLTTLLRSLRVFSP